MARIEPYQAQYMFEGIEYAPLMYKTIMRLVTIDSVANPETLCTNLNNLPSYAASVNSNVNLINSYFDTNYTQILARGATVDDPIAKLFDAYLSVPDYNFKQYISKKQDDYHNRNLGANFTLENLMAQVTTKFTYLKVRQIWGVKSPGEEKLIAMIADLKGKLKLAPNLEKKKKKKNTRARDNDNERSNGEGEKKGEEEQKGHFQQEESKEKRRLEEGTPQGRRGQREDHQGEDLPLVQASHGLEHTPSQGQLPWTLKVKEGCPESPSADDGHCCRCISLSLLPSLLPTTLIAVAIALPPLPSSSHDPIAS
jgi:hypothetical protein